MEIQLGFSTVTTKRHKHVFLLNLHSICIIDRTLQEVRTVFSTSSLCSQHSLYQDMATAAMDTLMTTMSAPLTLKRHVGYDQEEETEIDQRLKKLKVGMDPDMEVEDEL